MRLKRFGWLVIVSLAIGLSLNLSVQAAKKPPIYNLYDVLSYANQPNGPSTGLSGICVDPETRNEYFFMANEGDSQGDNANFRLIPRLVAGSSSQIPLTYDGNLHKLDKIPKRYFQSNFHE